MKKVFKNAEEAIAGISDGMTLMFGGFGLCGLPENCIRAIAASGIKNITTISNDSGTDKFGLGLLTRNHQIKKIMSSYIGENDEAERQLFAGTLEVELIPQGTLAERCRAGGAGIPAFYVPAGYGTEIARGKEAREFNGKPYLLETALQADFALVKAWKGDTMGNLIYRLSACNFNHVMAMAGKITIAEVEELVPAGSLDPNQIHTPGIFVQRIFQGEKYIKPIERLMVRD